MGMLGMPGMDDAAGATARWTMHRSGEVPADAPADQPQKKKKFSLKDAIDVAKEAIP